MAGRSSSYPSVSNGLRTITRLTVLGATAAALAALAGGVAGASERPQHCPRGEPGFDANRIEGERTRRARRIAARHACTIRVVKRDGVEYAVTDDFVTNRINVVVRDRHVVRVTGVH
jgi:hypothetical protein